MCGRVPFCMFLSGMEGYPLYYGPFSPVSLFERETPPQGPEPPFNTGKGYSRTPGFRPVSAVSDSFMLKRVLFSSPGWDIPARKGDSGGYSPRVGEECQKGENVVRVQF